MKKAGSKKAPRNKKLGRLLLRGQNGPKVVFKKKAGHQGYTAYTKYVLADPVKFGSVRRVPNGTTSDGTWAATGHRGTQNCEVYGAETRRQAAGLLRLLVGA